jgi:DNA-binding XRE family transcriptional regulator
MTTELYDVQEDIDAAHADPARHARVQQYRRENELILLLSAIREATGMTQEDFAGAASMSQENISRIERATDVKMSTIRRLARSANAELELTAVLPDGRRIALLVPAGAVGATRKGRRKMPAS